MITIPNLSPSAAYVAKSFNSETPNVAFYADGKNILIVHGDEYGKLEMEDEELDVVLPFVDLIICCHPKRVIEVYERIFPGISHRIAHKWADIPTCFGVFPQPNGLHSVVVLDYNPSRKEWQIIASQIEKKIKAG